LPTVTVVPPAPPVVPAAKPSAVLDHVRPPPETGLNAHCLFVLAVQVSWMIGFPAVVDAPWSEMHNPLETLMI
jgi:hypothetical protein